MSESIYSKLVAIAANIGPFPKTNTNWGAHKSKYRSIDDLKNAFHKELIAEGVVIHKEIIEFSEVPFQDIDKDGQPRTGWRTKVIVRVHFSSDQGSISTDEIVAKNGYGDFGPKAAASLALSQAIETVFCIAENPAADLQQPQAKQQQPKPQRQATRKQPLKTDPFAKWGISQAQAEELTKAINNAESRKDLDAIWKGNPGLQKAPFFVNAVKKRTAAVSMPKVLQNKEVKNK